MTIKPTNSNTGPRKAQRRLPTRENYLRNKKLSPQTRLDRIKKYSSAILDEDFSTVKKIVQLVMTSNFEKEVMEAAGKAVRMIKPWHIDLDQNYRTFGYKESVYPFQVGLLYELLDRRIALPLFKQNFLNFITQDKIHEGNQTLLCFSSPLEAASFALALWQEYPAQTDQLLSRSSKGRRDYPFRGYKRSVFKSLFDAKKQKAIKSIPDR